ncbi:MAG: tRNA (adenosine(37)-N6)-threonylcarbamoyltransferase complex ATPase subunit type 1 TsaE [Planctomycetes bacterium]|nr:tRNA (adenosine(37)-N6)-threonylcarbamoyltransferase complex ATPase subunit type 1 TsaE [Planctomycetota bacterium]
MNDVSVETASPEATEGIASRLARALDAGDRILLHGDLGGGKTTFVRGLLRGLDHPDPREVASPTFAIHHRYVGGRLPVDHLDLYRLDPGPALSLQGILDPLDDPDSVTAVEWPERLDGLPSNLALEVHLRRDTHRELHRRLHLVFVGARGERLRDVWSAAAGKDTPS